MSISGFVNVIYIIDILSDEDLYSNEKIEFQMSGKKISLPNNTASQLLKSIVTITSNNPVYFVKIHNIPMFMNFMEEVATNVEKKAKYQFYTSNAMVPKKMEFIFLQLKNTLTGKF
jgi:hypothetical protein